MDKKRYRELNKSADRLIKEDSNHDLEDELLKYARQALGAAGDLKFSVGDEVEARWECGPEYYQGKVVAVQQGKNGAAQRYTVKYHDDGIVEVGIPASLMRCPVSLDDESPHFNRKKQATASSISSLARKTNFLSDSDSDSDSNSSGDIDPTAILTQRATFKSYLPTMSDLPTPPLGTVTEISAAQANQSPSILYRTVFGCTTYSSAYSAALALYDAELKGWIPTVEDVHCALDHFGASDELFLLTSSSFASTQHIRRWESKKACSSDISSNVSLWLKTLGWLFSPNRNDIDDSALRIVLPHILHALLLLRLDSIRSKVAVEGEAALSAVLLLALKHSMFDVVSVVLRDIVYNNDISRSLLHTLGLDLISCTADLKRVHRLFLYLYISRLFPDTVTTSSSLDWNTISSGFEQELAGTVSMLLKHISTQGKSQEFFENRFEDIYWVLSSLPFALGAELSSSLNAADSTNIELWKTVDMEASKVVRSAKNLKTLDYRISNSFSDVESSFKILLSSYMSC